MLFGNTGKESKDIDMNSTVTHAWSLKIDATDSKNYAHARSRGHERLLEHRSIQSLLQNARHQQRLSKSGIRKRREHQKNHLSLFVYQSMCWHRQHKHRSRQSH
eukprot:TRINITY_DN11528_c0_g1_i1.p1 TRINITY_DN11528_c0_g1~~TRINITY_DN11528_c0_g1_i1.p1  ORF type:complete len:104 (+),score=7.83 TRINITY_DN11528_c0_g1_i1:228-539(+)